MASLDGAWGNLILVPNLVVCNPAHGRVVELDDLWCPFQHRLFCDKTKEDEWYTSGTEDQIRGLQWVLMDFKLKNWSICFVYPQ